MIRGGCLMRLVSAPEDVVSTDLADSVASQDDRHTTSRRDKSGRIDLAGRPLQLEDRDLGHQASVGLNASRGTLFWAKSPLRRQLPNRTRLRKAFLQRLSRAELTGHDHGARSRWPRPQKVLARRALNDETGWTGW